MPLGSEPTAIVDVTVLVVVLITDTVPEISLVTYTRLPSELTAVLLGLLPTVIVATTALVVVLITDTVLELAFVMYANLAFVGVAVIVAVTGLVPVFTAVNEAILPLPLAANPMPGVSLVQVMVLAVPVKLTAVVAFAFTTV